MKKILIGRQFYRQKLKELDEKRKINGKLDSKDLKQYRDISYAIVRLDAHVIKFKMIPVICITMFLSIFLVPKLPPWTLYILIICCWLGGYYLVTTCKKNGFVNFRHANKLWYIFVMFVPLVISLIGGISTNFLSLILCITSPIYITYYGRKVYIYGKKVSNE